VVGTELFKVSQPQTITNFVDYEEFTSETLSNQARGGSLGLNGNRIRIHEIMLKQDLCAEPLLRPWKKGEGTPVNWNSLHVHNFHEVKEEDKRNSIPSHKRRIVSSGKSEWSRRILASRLGNKLRKEGECGGLGLLGHPERDQGNALAGLKKAPKRDISQRRL